MGVVLPRFPRFHKVELERLQPAIRPTHAEAVAVSPIVHALTHSIKVLGRLCCRSRLRRCCSGNDDRHERARRQEMLGIIAEELRRRGWLWGYGSVVSVEGITFNV